ncbi:MAG: phosphatase PAP2 family protein, partial [Nanoarchaeota archaeon]
YILNLIYVLDKPVNLFPSLHVSMTFLAFLIISKFKKDLRIIILIAFILSALSTLFIKQHYLLDTLAGLVLGFISYKIYFKK